MSSTIDGATVSSLVASYEDTHSQVSVKAVVSQVALMTGVSVRKILAHSYILLAEIQVATVVAFSFFRPREKKVTQVLHLS